LVEGGSATITELNSLFADIDSVGSSLGEEVAASLYGTGIDMANGLLEGIKSRQEALEQEARNLAEAFNTAFQTAVNAQIDTAKAAAEATARAGAQAQIDALGPMPKVPPVIDEADLKLLNDFANTSAKILSKTTRASTKAGLEAKGAIIEALRQDVLAGAQLDLTGLNRGMSSADLLELARKSGSQTVNTVYNITVTPGSRADTNRTVEALREFVNQNGSLVSYGVQ
jgi:hypothetical protein